MIFRRGLRRWLLDCAVVALATGALSLPATSASAKPDEKSSKTAAKHADDKAKSANTKTKSAKTKPAKAAADKSATGKTETDKSAANKTAANKPAAAKPASTKTKPAKAVAKPEPKATKPAASAAAPLPRTRPVMVLASAPNPPGGAGHLLGPTKILPTTSFSLVTPAEAATAPAETLQALPPIRPPVAKASVLPSAPLATTDSASTPRADVDLVKQALDLVRRGKTSDATTIEKSIGDPLARKLVEWTIVRSDENDAGFDRLAAFSNENPSWPNAVMIRKRAEGALWDERRSGETVRAFFASSKPITAKGKFALARALQQQGDAATAAQLVRQAWREDTCSASVEKMVMETFGDVLTRATTRRAWIAASMTMIRTRACAWRSCSAATIC
jgi:soluble lytic murein transglycosylase